MDPTSVFAESNYRSLLRLRQKSLVRERPNLTWKIIASKIGVQHTYLSRSLTREEVHLNEDHFFEVLDILKFEEREREYLMLLRAKALTESESRRAYLQQKIDTMVKDHFIRVQTVKKEASLAETAFLMNPLLVLIYIALHIQRYANAPSALEKVFGLSGKQLKSHLAHLQEMGLIRLSPDEKCVVQVEKNTKHFSKEHPLMRGHQQILRHLCAAKIARTEDHEKVSFMASFTASEEAFAKIKEEFFEFLNKTQKLASVGTGTRIYQLAFDLFCWD